MTGLLYSQKIKEHFESNLHIELISTVAWPNLSRLEKQSYISSRERQNLQKLYKTISDKRTGKYIQALIEEREKAREELRDFGLASQNCLIKIIV